jgi:phage portal protein BeeE
VFRVRTPRAFFNEFRASSGLAVPQDWFSDALTGPTTMAGENVSVLSSLQVADVFAAVNLISEEVAKL